VALVGGGVNRIANCDCGKLNAIKEHYLQLSLAYEHWRAHVHQ
jgi:hypothetical protein